MINEIAFDLIKRFDINKYTETGVFKGASVKIVSDWFEKLDPNFSKLQSKFSMYEIDLEKKYIDDINFKYVNNPNIKAFQGNSPEVLQKLINDGYYSENDNCLFFLDAHWNEYIPMLDELCIIKQIKNAIILLDDFKTPGTRYGFCKYGDIEFDINYIRDVIKDKTDMVYYAGICNTDARGLGMVFYDRTEKEIDLFLQGLRVFKEKI